jgi:hypothetical protein
VRQHRPHKCDPPMNQDLDVLLFYLECRRNLLVVLPASAAHKASRCKRGACWASNAKSSQSVSTWKLVFREVERAAL